MSTISQKMPTRVKILTHFGLKLLSECRIEYNNFYWRLKPEALGCNVSLISDISKIDDNQLLIILYPNHELKIECPEVEETEILFKDIVKSRDRSFGKISEDRTLALANALFVELAMKQELTHQLIASLTFQDGLTTFCSIIARNNHAQSRIAWSKWAKYVHEENTPAMLEDRQRWRYHAISNQELDLQAWYHAVYYQEVYRPRGQFWYRDAVLPVYRNSYDLTDNGMSPMEEAALAHVLCSPETTYGDVAGQMFVVQDVVKDSNLFAMFHKLSAQGATVLKVPKTGHASKKLFRFSYVEGSIYLTWKGKQGNQGVDLAEVSNVISGGFALPTNTSTIGKGGAPIISEDLCLSIISGGKSIDLCFATKIERDSWKGLLDVLIDKEKGRIHRIKDDIAPSYQAKTGTESAGTYDDAEVISDAEWLMWYSSLGEGVLPIDIRGKIISSM